MKILSSWLAFPLVAVGLLANPARAANEVLGGSLVTFNDNAAWSWFEDERAIVDTANGKIVVSSVAVTAGTGGAARNGDVDVASLDLASGTVSRFVLRAALEADDHNSAALWQRPDGRYVAMYAKHISDNFSRWRVSTNPGDISSWSPEQSLNNTAGATYSNLHYLPNDNGGAGRLYNFVRSIGFDPNILVSGDQGSTWAYGGRLLAEGGSGDRPYVRYFSEGNRIHFITTERHPRDFDNSIYHGYIQDGQLYNSAGAVIDANLFDATAVTPASLSPVFATGTVVAGEPMRHGWTVDTSIDSAGRPIAVFQARASNESTDHRFFYGRWDGSQWNINPLGYAGSYLYAAEGDYTGLVSIDPSDPNTLYLSSEVHPATKAQLIGADGNRHYEIFRGKTSDNGANWSWTPITYNSTQQNVRPLVPKWDANHTALLWMRGAYSTYTNYNMDAVGLVDPNLSEPALALAVDIGATGQQNQSGFQTFTRSMDPAGNAQTEAYASPISGPGGQIAVTLGGGNVQFFDRGDNLVSPLAEAASDFVSLEGDLTLTLGNLARGNYQLVLYSHDQTVGNLAANIMYNGVAIGRVTPSTGVDPTIGVSSSRVGFAATGNNDIVLTLARLGTAGAVALNGFELYFIDNNVAPPVDLNGDGQLNLLDFQTYIQNMHTSLTGLTAGEAYARGDLNGDLQNNFADFILFQQGYDLWNGAGAFAAASAVPEPTSVGLLILSVLCTQVRPPFVAELVRVQKSR